MQRFYSAPSFWLCKMKPLNSFLFKMLTFTVANIECLIKSNKDIFSSLCKSVCRILLAWKLKTQNISTMFPLKDRAFYKRSVLNGCPPLNKGKSDFTFGGITAQLNSVNRDLLKLLLWRWEHSDMEIQILITFPYIP